jgi:hypothetical protein
MSFCFPSRRSFSGLDLWSQLMRYSIIFISIAADHFQRIGASIFW